LLESVGDQAIYLTILITSPEIKPSVKHRRHNLQLHK